MYVDTNVCKCLHRYVHYLTFNANYYYIYNYVIYNIRRYTEVTKCTQNMYTQKACV